MATDTDNVDRAEGVVPVTVLRSFSGYQVVRKHLSDLAAGNVPPKDKPSALHFGMLNLIANNFKELSEAYEALYDLYTAAVRERGELASQVSHLPEPPRSALRLPLLHLGANHARQRHHQLPPADPLPNDRARPELDHVPPWPIRHCDRAMSDDKRFTNGLIFDVVSALEKHGYKNTDVRAMGQFVGDLLELTQTFEGTPSLRAPSLTDQCPPECECGRSGLEGDKPFDMLAELKGRLSSEPKR